MKAENALLTKARAMYAKRLTPKNYAEMLQCKSVHDVASYLKSKTTYGDCLDTLNISSIHRGWLEANLKDVLFQKFEALSHYDYSMGDTFYEYFVVSGEITQLIRCASLINNGSKEKYLRTLPNFFNERAVLDLVSLGKASTLDELLAVLEGTPYYSISQTFIKKGDTAIDMFNFAKALDAYKYQKLFTLIRTVTKGSGQKALLEYGQMLVDLYNVEALYRVNKVRHYGSTLQGAMVTVAGGSLSESLLIRLSEAPSKAEFTKLFRTTPYARYLRAETYEYIELATHDLLYQISLHALRFSVHPRVVMLAYATLLQIELDNIIHIIEGIRYNVKSDEISKLLIGISDTN